MGRTIGLGDVGPGDDELIEELVFMTRRWRGQFQRTRVMPSYRHADRTDNPTEDDLAVELAIRRRIEAIEEAAGVHYAWHDRVPD
jgi:hypothetical protein